MTGSTPPDDELPPAAGSGDGSAASSAAGGDQDQTLHTAAGVPFDASSLQTTTGQPAPPATDLSGRELTMQTPAGGPPPSADLSGRELTMQTPAGGSEASLSGRELTMQTPAGGSEASLSGRELTMQTPSGGSEASLSGRELTMQTPSGAFPMTGRELTMETPAGGSITGRELTMTPTGGAQGDATRATPSPRGTPTPATMGGKPGTGAFKPRTRTGIGSSGGFDDAWHLSGRKGPFTGQTWGDFELGGIVGEGGMGAVYRAKQKSLKRRVAIKVLPPNLAADHRLLTRFHLEASTASKLQSPHVVQVYFIGEHEGNHFYAMEFVEGVDLYDELKRRRDENKMPTPDEACNWVLQAAKGLAEAARHGVVHRDIKPPNLMLTRDGLVKIADFGIVKVLGEHNLTMTGQAVGTPAYVSPEQGRGDREVDPRSDLYSLGVVFYELATGQKPFNGTTPNALIYQHCYDEPTLPKEIVSGISMEIQAVIMRCLQKKPENRYQSADELVRDLEAIRTGSMLKSAIANYKLGTGAEEAKREQMNFFQRHLLPIAVAAVLVVGGGGAFGWWYLKTSSAKTRQAELAALERKNNAESRVKTLRQTLAVALDNVAPLPEQVEAKLDELASYAPDGKQDADVKRWSAKVARVRELQTRLGVVESPKISVQERQSAKADLQDYVALVGGDEALASKASARLAKLDADEARLRTDCAKIDTLALKKGDRDRFVPLLDALAAIVPADDASLIKWRKRIAGFDAGLADLRKRISPLDKEQSVTEAKRAQYAAILADLKGYLDDTDPDLRRWSDHLEAAKGSVARLREQVTSVVGQTPDLIGKPKQDQIADKLAAYRALVGDDDSFVKDWQAAITAADGTITGCRTRLAEKEKQAEGLLAAGVQPPFERDLKQLAALVYDGDAEVLKWEQLLRDSRRAIADLREDLKVLEPSDPRPIAMAAQVDLAGKLTRLAAKGGIEPDRADIYRQRLTAEKARVDALRDALAGFDRAEPLTPMLLSGLDRFAQDVGGQDKDVLRWQAKRDEVADLDHRIGAIDRKEPVPEDLDRLFTRLEALVGPQDPQLVSWRGKVARINEARAALAVLDRRASFDAAAVDAGLATLGELVGTGDRAYVRWKTKADEVKALKQQLAGLPGVLALAPVALDDGMARLRRLAADLVGPDDADVRIAAARLQELSAPRPAWALESGRDGFGPWATAALPGGQMRFRFVPSAGFAIGSPDAEPGHEVDELRVPVRIQRGFWIAETECPQAVWRAVMGSDPSRGRGDPAHQPVDRVSWRDSEAFFTALHAAVPNLPARLPWEVEWELACRAGGDAPWSLPAGVSADADGVGKVAWMAQNAHGAPHESGGRLPNPLGLYDMQGNLAEWVADAYQPYPTGGGAVTAPWAGGGEHVVRGGSWGDDWIKTRAANRIPARPDLRSVYVGLRLAVDAEWPDGPPDGGALLAQLGVQRKDITLSLGLWKVTLERDAGDGK